MAEFLRQGPADQTREVIEELVRAAQPEPVVPAPLAAPPSPLPAREVLDELVAPAAPARPPLPSQQAAAPAGPATIEAPQADRDLLDSLIHKEHESP